MDFYQLAEQRCEPRFKTDFSATITVAGGSATKATITNLSLSGMQLTGSGELIQKLAPNICRQNHFIPINFAVNFSVPTSLRAWADVDLSCTLVYTRRTRPNLYLVGCNFSRFNHESANRLEDYIEHFGVLI